MTDNPLFPEPSFWTFDGETFEPDMDMGRLKSQMHRVWYAMRDGKWRTLADISDLTGDPEASVGSRLRDFRKKRYGERPVATRRVPGGNGLHVYRLVPEGEEL